MRLVPYVVESEKISRVVCCSSEPQGKTGNECGMLSSEKGKRSQSPIEAEINENLRKVYEESLDETIPDRFRALLDELRKKEQQK